MTNHRQGYMSGRHLKNGKQITSFLSTLYNESMNLFESSALLLLSSFEKKV